MNPKLVPLRIPSGWKVCLNDFTESSPERFTHENYEFIWEFKEDILLLENNQKKRIVDLGWYPEFKVEGQYYLKLLDTHHVKEDGAADWNVLRAYETRNIEEIQRKIEEFLLTE